MSELTDESLREEALSAIAQANTLPDLEGVRIRYLGRKGLLTQRISQLSSLEIERRRERGRALNEIKTSVESTLEKRQRALTEIHKAASLDQKMDVTLPGEPFPLGRLHPLTQVLGEILEIFRSLGFSVEEGPEIETDFNNFTALNIPSGHPARDLQDTFYIADSRSNNSKSEIPNPKLLLRTHTSPVQIRAMKRKRRRKSTGQPLRIVSAGRVYRHEATDASHAAEFHQVEGLSVDEKVSFLDLKTTLEIFVKRMFGAKVRMRLRPSYFPFVEPGAEADISCILCAGKGCRVCQMSGWLEMMGAGMVHPNVFKNVGYDPKRWRGFAFGMGVERIAMLRFGIDDIRLFLENDLRFLRQF